MYRDIKHTVWGTESHIMAGGSANDQFKKSSVILWKED